jgi:prepilin-type processing-associated H-X9-DG protein
MMADTWYGANAVEHGNGANAANYNLTQSLWPMRTIIWRTQGKKFVGTTTKISQIRHPAEMVLLFDGLRILDDNTNRISGRHNQKKYTNLLMADGHVVMANRKSLPDLTESEMLGTDLKVFDKFPGVKWRLDQ